MTPKPPPTRGQLPPEARAALDPLCEDEAPDADLDAIHDRMRARFHAMLAERLPADDAATKAG